MTNTKVEQHKCFRQCLSFVTNGSYCVIILANCLKGPIVIFGLVLWAILLVAVLVPESKRLRLLRDEARTCLKWVDVNGGVAIRNKTSKPIKVTKMVYYRRGFPWMTCLTGQHMFNSERPLEDILRCLSSPQSYRLARPFRYGAKSWVVPAFGLLKVVEPLEDVKKGERVWDDFLVEKAQFCIRCEFDFQGEPFSTMTLRKGHPK